MKFLTIEQFLKQNESKDLLRFSTAGSIDDGKSTLIGRLLHDSKMIYEDHIAAVKKVSMGVDTEIDYALFTDGLKAEREQGITIDVAYRHFSTPRRKFIIADTPGHEQYTRNMATGASTADLAVILIDARNGVLPQTKRHAFISSLLGVPHMIVAVNKMDLVGYGEEIFSNIKNEFSDFAKKLKMTDLRFIPISALKGDNVVKRSSNMRWYSGESLMEILENIYIASDKHLEDLRLPIQYVLRPNQEFRGYCGQIVSGVLRVGDEVLILPSMKSSKVKTIESFEGRLNEAFSPMSVTFTLEDEIDISRGDIVVHLHNVPRSERHFESMLIWMSDEAMDTNRSYFMKIGAQTERMRFDRVRYKVDIDTLDRQEVSLLKLNEVGRVVTTAVKPIFFDSYEINRGMGSFIVIDSISNNTVAAGMILNREPSDHLPSSVNIPQKGEANFIFRRSQVSLKERKERLRQNPHTIWITGLISSGKTEVAYALERRLFDLGCTAIVLDGENVRLGLNKELDFTAVGRAEHLRRVAETAKMFNEAGIIVICAFLSPIELERKEVAHIIGVDRYIDVFLDAPPKWCEERDTSGIYAKARSGELENVAGVNMPYEAPHSPSMKLEMNKIGMEKAVDQIITHLRKQKLFLLN